MLVHRAVELKKGSHVRLVAQVLVSLRFTVLQAVGSVHCLAGAGIPGRQVLAGIPSTNRMESHGTVPCITPDYGTFRPPADRTLPIPPAPNKLTILSPLVSRSAWPRTSSWKLRSLLLSPQPHPKISLKFLGS